MTENNSKDSDTKTEDINFRTLRPGGSRSLSFWDKFFSPNYNSDYHKTMCEYNVLKAFKTNPILRILKGALENAGCPLDIKRHIVCEECSSKVVGGFDHELNQVIVCNSTYETNKNPDAVLIHELIHMYDHCVNEVDFKNLEHLACTEIRAANISHCSFFSSAYLGQSSPINIKKTHQYCVKLCAAQSLVVARNLDFTTALKCVLKVFDKCYNDLEPIGRRIRKNSNEAKMAEEEAKCFLITKE